MNGSALGEENAARSLLIAAGVALACSALVTLAVHQFRPVQAAWAAIDRNRAIAFAADLIPADAPDRVVVGAFLELDVLVIDLESRQFVDRPDARTFDHWRSGVAGDRQVPIYLRREDGRVVRVIFPIDGQGMWSTLRGYLALSEDLNTVARLVIHEHGETPGIGDRIQDPDWLGQWVGKRLYDGNRDPAITVSRGGNIPEVYHVDTITGATVSSEAVGRMVREWFGDNGYRPILALLRQELGEESR